MKVTLITAVFNNCGSIRDCINSVLSQSYPHIEYLIVDGGSTDGTIEVIQSYNGRINKFVSEPDRGIYDALNKGIRMAMGDIVGFLHSDDVYAGTEVITKVAEGMERTRADVSYGDLVYVDANDTSKVIRYWRAGAFRNKKFYNGWMPPHPTFFVRRSLYERCGGFKLDLGSAADYELMLRLMLKHGMSAVYIPEILVRMRVGGMSNATMRNRVKANRMDRRAWKVNGLKPYPWTLWMKPLRKVGQYFVKP